MLRVLSRQGDAQFEWDSGAAESGDPEALAAIAEAERIFAEGWARGARAYIALPDGRYVRTDRLVRDAREIVVIPPVFGG
jgi:molybdopterin converting factor small subunit